MESPLEVAEDVDFGQLAAENDIGPVSHTSYGRGLEKYFVESDDYKRVRATALYFQDFCSCVSGS